MRVKRSVCLVLAFLMALIVPAPSFAGNSGLTDEDVHLTYVLTYDSNEELIGYEEYNSSGNLMYKFDALSDYYYSEIFRLYDKETGHIVEEKKTHTEYKNGREYPYNDHRIVYKCDDEGRIIESDQGYGSWVHQFQYDENGNLIIDKFKDGSVYTTTEYTYDDQNRLMETVKKNAEGNPVETTEITYKEEGLTKYKITNITYNVYEEIDTFTEKWTYDEKGRLVSSVERNYTSGPGIDYTDYFYNDQDQLIRTEFYLNLDRPHPQYDPFETEYTYTKDGRLESETNEEGKTIVYLYTLKEFGDVFADDYFAKPVKWAVEQGITKGTADATDFSNAEFSPDDSCTRGQAVTFLWRAAGSPEPKSANNPFKDVKSDAFYYKAVLWAAENNITQGTSADTFTPSATCNRGQIVTFLWRFRNSPKATKSVPFTDVKSGAFYYNAVSWAVENSITNGTSDKTFSPNNDCTRGQIVTFLYRAIAE